MILLLDHDDSFVFTLARYVEELGKHPRVVRARSTSVAAIAASRPTHIILSPGPGTPDDCATAVAVIRELGRATPILGVCLGHQCIAAAYGARVERTGHPRHGQTSLISHDGVGVFTGIENPMHATRYHSLAVVAGSAPPALELAALSDDGDVMGIRHRTHPVHGVQFHPESILTDWGHQLLANFLGVSSVGWGKNADQGLLSFTPCSSSDGRLRP